MDGVVKTDIVPQKQDSPPAHDPAAHALAQHLAEMSGDVEHCMAPRWDDGGEPHEYRSQHIT